MVGHVIINRLNHPDFPNTIEEVIFQSNQFVPTTFPSFRTTEPNRTNINAARAALTEADLTQGALFFRAIQGADNSWHERSLERLLDYGGHRFYR